jgi:DNA-binding protein WhiA
MTLGSVHLLGRGQIKVEFTMESAAITRRVFLLLQKEFSIVAQVHAVTHPRFGGLKRYVLTLNPFQSPVLLTRFSMMDLNFHGEAVLKGTSPKPNLNRTCCMRAFIRGAMLGSGTMSQLESGYHLDLTVKDSTFGFSLAKCLQRFQLPIQKSRRKGDELFFFTQGEQIVTLLTLMGAHQAVMKLEDLRVRREVMGNVNRAMNCDAANLKKLMDASSQQVEQISRLIDSDRFQSLPPSLQEIATARIQAPDASLTELGQMLSPPLGKSGVNHRMRRLMDFARKEGTSSE